MFKNAQYTFLAGVLLTALIVTPLYAHNTYAATVTDRDVEDQELVVRDAATYTVQQYVRLLLYVIIMRLEERVDTA